MRNGLDLERSCKLMGSKLLGVKTFLEVHDFLFRIKKIILKTCWHRCFQHDNLEFTTNVDIDPFYPK